MMPMQAQLGEHGLLAARERDSFQMDTERVWGGWWQDWQCHVMDGWSAPWVAIICQPAAVFAVVA